MSFTGNTSPDRDGLLSLLRKAGFDPETVHWNALTGGVSHESFRVQMTEVNGAGHHLVLRMDRPGEVGVGLSLQREYELIEALDQRGFVVPSPVALESGGEALARTVAVYEWVEGHCHDSWSSIRRRRGEKEFERCQHHYVETLAHIHELHPCRNALGLDVPENPRQSTRREIARWTGAITPDVLEGVPLMVETEAWLTENIPDFEQLSLVHGDYRLSNLIFGDSSIRAVLDWEVAFWGDPAADLGFSLIELWGRDFYDLERLRSVYESVRGRRVSEFRIRYWTCMGFFKFIAAMLRFRTAFNRGQTEDLQGPLSCVQLPRYLRMLGESLERARESKSHEC